VVIDLESISLLLAEALSPYQVTLTPSGLHGECLVTLKSSTGAIVVERAFNQTHLMIAEGRLEPCVIAALRNAAQDKLLASRN
jgi:hypothetical protein